MKTVTHTLQHPISYSMGGAVVECSHIELVEPTGRVSHICNAIEGLVQSAILKAADAIDDSVIEQAQAQAGERDPADAEAEEKDGDSILAVVMSGGTDMEKLTLHFRELFREVALMGGEKKLTTPRMDDMSHRDFKALMGKYTANFILS